MASETCSERSIEGLWLHTWFHTFSGPTCPTQARDAQVIMWRKCPFYKYLGPLCPVLARNAIYYGGAAPRRTRNPDGLSDHTAAWIPGSREDARPGMTALGRA